MTNPSFLRRSRAGHAGSSTHVHLALLALVGIATLLGLAATLTLAHHPHDAGPAPHFLEASLGAVRHPSSASASLPSRTFASMRTAVTPHGLRVSAKWADLGVTSLDAGGAKWTRYAAGAARTTSFGSETVSLAGVSAEEYLTVSQHRGSHTWRWLLNTSLIPHLSQNGEITFTNARGQSVLMHISAPSVLDAHGQPVSVSGLHWGLASDRGRRILTLHLDDTALPLPYTIDPSVSLTGAAYTTVKGVGTKAGSFTLTIPSGAANGDLLVVQLAVRQTTAPTAPSGWALFASQTIGTDLGQYMYTRTMASPDVTGTSYTWTINAGIDAAGGMVALRNIDGAPTNPSQQTAVNSGTTSPASATVTTDSIIGSDSDYVLAFYGGAGNFTFTETNASLSSIWASATNEIPNGGGSVNGGTVSSGSSGTSRTEAAISAGLFTASTGVTPSATLSATPNEWILHILAFRPALPYNQVVPTETGTVAVGQTLTATTGTWSNSPTAYTYQWLRCDSGGANCVAIAGATASSYVLAAADSGSTVRVQVGASNALGGGATAQSAQTALVPAADGSGTLTTSTASVSTGATGNTVTFTYTAATGGLSAGKVQLTIPSGWTAPSTTGANAGYTTSTSGTVGVAGQVVTVSNVTLAGGATMTVAYGSKASGGTGATASTTAGSQAWVTAEGSTSTGTITSLASSPSITVNPGPATKLGWSQQPSNAGAGATISPSPTISVQDTYGNTVTSSSASITVAIGTNPGGGTLSGTTTVSAASGVATFSTLSINKAGSGYTLQAASSGLTSATSSGFNIAAGAPAKLALVQQPTTVGAGSSISPSVTVAVQDAAGNTVTTSSASVTAAIGTNPSGGTLSGTTTVTAASGIATFSNLSIDKTGSGYTLALSSTGLTPATSTAFNVNPGAASKLAFVQQPSSATAGVSISPAVTVVVSDALGNTVTSSAATIALAIGTNPGGGTLSGTTSTAASSGIASFSTLSINKGGTGYTLTASSTGLTGATSSSFSINAAAVSATQSTVSASPSSITANGTTSSTVTVTANDAFGNPVSAQSVSLAQGAGSSTISPASATTNAAGIATFTVTDTKAEAPTYTATIGITTILQTATVTYTAGPVSATQSTVSASPSTITANGTTSSTITVTLNDTNNNPVAGKTVTLTKSGGSSTISPASATTNTAGTATFTTTDTTAETTTYTATDTTDTLTPTQTATVTYTAGPATHFTLTAPATFTAGSAQSLTITALDAYGNTATGYTGTVHFTSSDSQATLPTDYTFATADTGTHTFTTTLKTAGTHTVTTTDTSNNTINGTTGAITVNSAAATNLAVTGPANATAGSSFSTLVVTAKDAFGNTATGYTGTVAFTGGGTNATLPGAYAFTAGDAGAHTFAATLTQAGSRTLTATDTSSGTITGTTSAITVAASSAASLQLTGAGTATAGSAQSLTITALDAYGNTATGYTGPHQVTFSGANASTAPVSAPTVTDNTGTAVSFGTATTLTFTNGVSTAGGSLILYDVEAATIAAAAPDGGAGSTPIASSGSASLAVSVGPGALSKFALSLTSPQTNGSAFGGVDTLTAEDAYGNVLTTFNAFGDNVTLSANAPLTGLVSGLHGAGVLNNAADFVNGVADLSALGLTYTGNTATGTFTATAATGESGTSGGVSVSPGTAAALVLTGSGTQTSGQAQSPTMRAVDGSGNTATSYTGDHALTFSGATTLGSFSPTVTDKSGTAVAFGTPTTVTFANGVATAGGSLVVYKAETAQVATTDGAIAATGANRLSVSVSAAGAASLELSAGSTSLTAGTPVALTITARDPFGNIATSYTGDHALTFGGGTTIGSFGPTVTDKTGSAVAFASPTTLSFTNGVSAAGGSLVLYKSENPQVTVTDGSHTNGAGTGFSVSPGAATALAFTSVNGGSSPTAGVGFPLDVQSQDTYGNPSTASSATAFALSLAAGTGTLGGTSAGTISAGQSQATVSGVTYTKAESGVRLTATRTSGDALTAGTSSPFTVATTGSRLVITSVNGGSSPTAGSPFSVTVQSQDDLGNAGNVTSATGVSLSLSTGNGTLGGTLTATIPAGQSQVTISGTTYTKAESGISITASRTSGDTLLSGTSSSFSVTPGAAATFVVSGSGTQTAGTPNALTITALDANGNVATGYTGDHTLTFSGATAIGSFTPTASDKAGTSVAFGTGTTMTFAKGVSTAGGSVTSYRVETAQVAATDGSIVTPSLARLSVSVSPAATSTLSLTTTAGTPQTAGSAFAVTATAKDPFGNTTPGYTGTVGLTSSDGQATLPAAYVFASSDNGQHTFSGVALKTAGSATVSATDQSNGSISATSGAISVAPAATDHLLVATTAAATQSAGVAFDATVVAKDAYGNITPAYTGTVGLTSSDGQAGLPAAYTFTGTDSGTHTFTGGVTLKTAGAQSITVTDQTNAPIAGTAGVTVGPAAATHLTVSAPASATAGSSFSVTVTAKDAYGNVATGYAGTLHVTSSATQAGLPADATAVTGAHTFTGVSVNTAGAQTVTVTDTSDGSITGAAAVTVNAAAASNLTVSAPGSATAGSPFSATVTAKDAYGNDATGYTGTVLLTASDTQALLPSAATFSGASHTFANIDLRTAGGVTLTATDTGQGSITGSAVVNVAAATAASLTVSTSAAAPQTAGGSFSVSVTALDAYGNTATGYNGSVHLTSSDAQAILPSDHTFVGGDSGVFTFSGADLRTAGSQTVTATDTGNAAIRGTSGPVSVAAAAVSHLAASTSAASQQTAGSSFDLTVTALDAYGNTTTGYAGTVHVNSGDPQALLPVDYTFVPGDNGSHTFAGGATLETSGTQTLSVTDTTAPAVNGSANVTVVAATATRFVLSTSGVSSTAGSALDATVIAEDSFGNRATGYTGTVHFTSDDPQAVLPGNYAFTAGDAGSHTFAGGTLFKTAGSRTFTATDVTDASMTGTSGTVAVSPAAASQLAFAQSPSSSVAGTTITPAATVRVVDSFGNLTTSTAAVTVAVASGTGAAGATLSGTLTRSAVAGVATFSDLSLDKASSSYALTANASGLAAATSATFSITAAGAQAAQSQITAAPSSVTADGSSAATVTVQAKDAFGNAVASGGATVALSSNLGTLSTLTDNGDGTYTASLTSTSAGSANISGTLNGSPLGNTASVTFAAGSTPSAAQSTLTATPTSVTADGTSAATLTVQAKDAFGNALTSGGATVALSTDLGTLSTLTDNTNGTYTATLTSTTTGTAHITGTLGGSALANNVSVTLTPGTASAATSTLTATPTSLTANGTSTATITLQAKDTNNNTLTTGGATIALSTNLGTLSTLTDNTNGTYTATLTSTTTGTAHITATLGGSALTNTASVTFTPGALSATQSTLTAASGAVSTDSASGTTITVTVTDAYGNPITSAPVSLAANSGSSLISPALGTTTSTNGVATFTVSDTVAESVVYSATAAGTLLTQTAAVQYLPGAANTTTTTLSTAPASLTAGASTTITVQAKDTNNNTLTTGGATIALSTNLGTLSTLTDNTNGTYTATLTSTSAGSANISGTLNGLPLGNTASVTFTPGAAAAAETTIAASPSTINADGSSGTATVTVQTKDAYGNAVATGGATVTLATDLGALSAVTDNGNGTYTATLSAGGTSGSANITGTLGGVAVAAGTTVTFAPPVPVAAIDSGPAAQSATANATFTFHSTNDSSATFECKVDSGSFAACTSPTAYNSLTDGAHTFTVRGVNANGPGPGVAQSWLVDTTPPAVALTNAPGAYTNNVTEALAASASDSTSGVSAVDFLFAATPAACPTGTLIFTATTAPYTTTWTLPGDGTYAVCAVAHDGAGNTSAPASTTVVVDRTKPSISLPTLGTLVGSDRYINGTPTLAATSSDATSGVSSVAFAYTGAASGTIATLAGTGAPGSTNPYSTNWATGSVPDGPYSVTATSTDMATNADSSSQTLIVDNTPPTASLDDPGAYGHGTLALTVTATDAGSGLNTAATVIQVSPHGANTWTPITTPAAWTPLDGTYDLRALVNDNVGNETTTATRTIMIDNTPPTITSNADGNWHAADVTVALSATDSESGVAGVQYQIDSGPLTTGTSVVIPAPSDGSNDGVHTITYRATNNAGVTSTDQTTTVKIDHTPPSNVTLDAPFPGALLHGTLATSDLAATAQDATSGIASTAFRLAPTGTLGTNPCDTFGTQITAPFDTTSVADGHYDLWVAAADAAGNGRCSVVPHDVIIDNTAPVTTDNAPAGAQNHDVSVNLAATDNLSGVAETDYSLDNGATWTPGTTVVIPAPSDGSNDGTHVIQYRSRDNAGNVEATKNTQVTIDTTAPAGNVTDPGSVLSGTVQLTASPTATDVASVQFLEQPSGGSGPFTVIGTDNTGAPWQVPWLTNSVADGSYDIEIIVTDQAGNSSTQLLSSKIVDNTAPDSAAVTAPAGGADIGGVLTLGALAHDATSGVAAVAFQVKWSGAADFTTVDASTSAPYTGSWNSTAAPDGPAEVRVAVTDVAGNGPTYSAPVSFTVDNTAPTVTLSAPAATNGVASLSASGSADIQSVKYEYSPHGVGSWTVIGTAGSPFVAPWATGSLSEGSYDVRATATDGGGNTGTAMATVLVDRTSPTATVTQPTSSTTVGGTSVALAATASDDASGVASVLFQYRPNGSSGAFTDAATLTSAPYTGSWDASGIPSGDYEIRTVVTDRAGNSSTTSTIVTVDSTPPTVSVLNIASAVTGTVAPTVATDADAANATYDLSPAGSNTWTQAATSTSAPLFAGSFNTAAFTDGLYDVRAVVRDRFGNATTVVVPNVRIDNTPPTLLSSTPADGSLLTSLSSVSATASEALSAISGLQVDGVTPSFTATITGADITFPTGVFADGNHAITGTLVDQAGLTTPFRINFTIQSGQLAAGAPTTGKNVSSAVPTTLLSADNAVTVTTPANVWAGPAPIAHDFLVLKINPSPSPSLISRADLTLDSNVIEVTMFWDISQIQEHTFDAPIEIDLTDPTGTNGTPATAEPLNPWRAIPELSQAGTLPAGQSDGYWRTGATVHILTRHLSLFTVMTGAAASLQVAPPHDFAGVVGADGLTLRWAPGVANDQIAHYTLYADGRAVATYGPRQFEAKLGPIGADDTRRFTITETTLDGNESPASPALRVVPSVAGLSVDAARQMLASRDFTLGKSIPVASPFVSAGTVVGPTQVAVLTEGSTVDVQVATTVVARSPFAVNIAAAPRVTVHRNVLVGRVATTTTARVDVTLDAYPYHRLQRWHFDHVKPGATILRMPLHQRLRPGLYRLFWKATSDVDHTVTRQITPVRALGGAGTHDSSGAIVVVDGSRTTQGLDQLALGRQTYEASIDEAFLFATYREVSAFVLNADVYGVAYVKSLRAVFPRATVIAVSQNAATRRTASRAGAIAVRSPATATVVKSALESVR